MVKLGIIGLGHMGGYHASVCQMIPNIKLVGVSDTNEQNLAKISSDKVIKSKNFLDWIDLVDGIIIAVPTDFHFSIAKACLERNKNILLEKPITKTIEQAKELFELAEKKDLVLHTGHVERFNGAVQELKKLIHKPYLIECHRMGPFSPRVQNDTVVLDLMIHDLDIVSMLVNSPVKTINVIGKTIKSEQSDIAAVHIEFENGTLANIISSRVSHIKKRMMSIHQESAFLQLDFTTQDIFIHRHSSASVKVEHNQMKYRQEATVERLFVYKENPLKQEIDYFANAIRTGKNKRDAQQDLDALKLTLTIEKALEPNHDCSHRRDGNTSQPSL
ncbi:Gfo/Idh/MocA family oxidoreductase [Candidatus Babeliales bacterium]|nr:Gfo/Idh/MocA family oxidoreductase [Candidatus Babeliales bacterium]